MNPAHYIAIEGPLRVGKSSLAKQQMIEQGVNVVAGLDLGGRSIRLSGYAQLPTPPPPQAEQQSETKQFQSKGTGATVDTLTSGRDAATDTATAADSVVAAATVVAASTIPRVFRRSHGDGYRDRRSRCLSIPVDDAVLEAVLTGETAGRCIGNPVVCPGHGRAVAWTGGDAHDDRRITYVLIVV